MSVLESDTKVVEERLSTLQTANDAVERECACLKMETKEKTDRLSKANEENKKSGEALSTISAELKALQEERKVNEAELAAATTELAALKEEKKKGKDELSTVTKELMEMKVKLADVEDQLEGEKEHVEAAHDELSTIRAQLKSLPAQMLEVQKLQANNESTTTALQSVQAQVDGEVEKCIAAEAEAAALKKELS